MDDIRKILESADRKVLMAVYPHPDDETMASAGLLIAAKRAGWKTVVVCLTHGEAGKMHIHTKGKSIREVRDGELRYASAMLKVDEIIAGDFADGKLRGSRQLWIGWLRREMNRIKPGVVITYDPSGFYGHPDHIAVSEEVYKLRGNFELFFVAIPESLRKQYAGRLLGISEVIKQMVVPTHILYLGWNFINKWRAVRIYRSQGLGKSLPIPLFLMLAVNRYEWYHRVSNQFKYEFKYTDYQI